MAVLLVVLLTVTIVVVLLQVLMHRIGVEVLKNPREVEVQVQQEVRKVTGV